MNANSVLALSLAALDILCGCGSEGGQQGDANAAGAGTTTTTSSVGGGAPFNAQAATGGSGATGAGGGSAQGNDSVVDLAFAGAGPTNPGDTQLDEENTCSSLALTPEEVQTEQEVVTTIETQVPAPVALYIMLDNSLSMDEDGSSAAVTKWDEAISALSDFVNDPASDGIDVAIQYFHPVGVRGSVDECIGDGQSVPAVDMGVLPDNASAILSSLRSTQTGINTPTAGALTGAIDYCTAFESTNPDEDCVVVLITDGLPHGCGLSAQCPSQTTGQPGRGSSDLSCVDPSAEAELTPVAASGLENGVVSFMIGMAGVTEDGFGLLDAVAIAGGSDCTPETTGDEACDVSTTGAAGFLTALTAIRDSITVVETSTETVVTTEVVTVPCQWTIPDSPSGEKLDPNLVNVDIVDTVSSQTTPLSYVASEADCALAPGPAYHYDNPAAPTTILVCPTTCDLITAQNTAKVDVRFGCARVGFAY